MVDWIDLDTQELNEERKEMIRGVEVTVLLSPNDVPEGVRGYYDQDGKRFVIEFKYMGEEPTREEQKDENLTLRIGKNSIGKNSDRLYAILIDINRLGANAVRLNVGPVVNDALTNLINNPRRKNRLGNYRLARDVISRRKDELFASLRTS